MRFQSIVLGFCVGLSFGFMGCGKNSSAVSGVKFDQQVVNGEILVSMDATLAAGGLVLPVASLPLYNPNNPTQILGEIATNGRHIIVNANASVVLKLPDLADGSKLPNGAPIPIILPAGLKPIGIPAFNSNSMVYLAVSGNQIMLGVAVSILKEDKLNLPFSVFLPFNISSELSGTAGFFLGEKQGVGVFALREPAAAPSIGPSVSAASRLAVSGLVGNGIAAPASAGRIEVKQESLTNSKMRRLGKAWNSLDEVRLD